MERLTLRLLGELRAYREGGADSAAAGRKAQALLAYLALNPRQRCTRERLASLLWSDRGEEQARHSLRQSVLALRKALDDLSVPKTSFRLIELRNPVTSSGGDCTDALGPGGAGVPVQVASPA